MKSAPAPLALNASFGVALMSEEATVHFIASGFACTDAVCDSLVRAILGRPIAQAVVQIMVFCWDCR
jgi:hypothetical protein